MKKSTLAKQVEYFYSLLELETENKNSGINNYTVIKNWYKISVSLFKLNEYEFVGTSIQEIFDSGANFQSSSQQISVLTAEYPMFIERFNIVKAKCKAIIDLNISARKNDDRNLYIKLPDDLKDLEIVSSIFKDLDISFNKCPILHECTGNITFTGVEHGSSWIILALGTAVALSKAMNAVADFVSKCNEIRIQNRTLQNLDLEIILKKMDIEEIEAEKYARKFKENSEMEIKNACIEKFKEIDSIDHDNKITPEEKSRIVHSMNTLMDLLDRGIEIYPSIESSEEIKNRFPKKEEFKQLEDSQKLLGTTENES